MLYSPTSHGFYHPEIHGATTPADAVEIPDGEYLALIEGQAEGKTIVPGAGGRPVLQDAPIPTEAEALIAWRGQAWLPRGAFCRALVTANILPAQEAIAAARGDWPDTFASALSSLPVDPVGAQIDWAAAPNIARTNPLFLAVLGFYAAAHNLSTAQAEALGDAIFGRT
jgi:hypothetical protein